MAEKRKRQAKTTRQQYELYLAELEHNTLFRNNTFTGENPTALKDTWAQLIVKLNSTGGPIKDVSGWKRVSFLIYRPFHLRKIISYMRTSSFMGRAIVYIYCFQLQR